MKPKIIPEAMRVKVKRKNPGRTFFTLANLILIMYIIVPIILVAVGSFGQKWVGTLFPEGFTFEWYLQLFSKRMYLRAIKMSLLIGLCTVLVNILLAIPAVYAIYLSGGKGWRNIFNGLVMLPIAIPPLLMGMGLIQAYNWPWFSLVGAWQLLLAAHVLYTIPFMIKPLMANMELINWHRMEEAAESLGAGKFYTVVHVLIPNLQPGIISGTVMTLAMSLGEFQLAVLLCGSVTQTYPVTLYQAFYVSTGLACAATMLLVLMAVIAIFATKIITGLLKKGMSIDFISGGAA